MVFEKSGLGLEKVVLVLVLAWPVLVLKN